MQANSDYYRKYTSFSQVKKCSISLKKRANLTLKRPILVKKKSLMTLVNGLKLNGKAKFSILKIDGSNLIPSLKRQKFLNPIQSVISDEIKGVAGKKSF